MIGITTAAGPRHYWHLWLDKNDYKIVEIDLRHTYFPFYEFIINHVADSVKNYDISLHSTTEALFSENELVRKAHQHLLLAEIDIAKRIGARQIVFHAPKFMDLNKLKKQKDNVKFLKDISKSTKEQGIQLLIEFPTKGPFTEIETLKKFFDMFPDLMMCLDVGHLVKIKNSLEKEKMLVNELKDFIVHLHINDSGDEERTEHRDFGEKEGHYLELLKYIKMNCPIKKAIIEIDDENIAKKINKNIKSVFG
ncbi:MAG: sugar phosphate isomerase/epimerase family protein [Nanoarchaeota archaeon]